MTEPLPARNGLALRKIGAFWGQAPNRPYVNLGIEGEKIKQLKKHIVALAGTALFGLAVSAYADEALATGGNPAGGMARGMMRGQGCMGRQA